MQQIFISVCLRYFLSTQLLSAEKTRKDNHEKLREYQRHDEVTGKKTDIDWERKTTGKDILARFKNFSFYFSYILVRNAFDLFVYKEPFFK